MRASRLGALWVRLGSVRLFESRRVRVCLKAVGEGLAAAAVMAGLVIGLAPVSTVPFESLERRSLEVVAGAPDTWLVMLYADAEDQLLEEDFVLGVNEAESVGSTEHVRIVAQLDRCPWGYEEEGSTALTQRYLIEKDDDMQALAWEASGALGELDMGDPQTLYDFATWAISKYPSEHYVLMMADHGDGWCGGWSDDAPFEGGWLTLPELDTALEAVVADTRIDAFELVALDACLMSEVEVLSALAPHARYAVGSEEVSTALGFSYASILGALTEDPSMSGRRLATVVVDSFIEDKMSAIGDQVAARWTNGDLTAQELLEALLSDHTLAAIDLSKMPDVVAALNRLALALAPLDQPQVARARTYAQSYESLCGSDNPNRPEPPSVVDLGSLVDMLLAITDDPEVAAAGAQVKQAVAEAVVAERHGTERPGSTGMAVYFPLSAEYEWVFWEAEDSYPRSVARFAAASLWDDYLTYHYTGRLFEDVVADLSVLSAQQGERDDFADAAERSTRSPQDDVVAPGAGGVELNTPVVSKERIGPNEGVTVSAEISGTNIADVYYHVARYSEEDGYHVCAAGGYLECPNVQTVGGLDLLDWRGGPLQVEFEWLPVLYYLSGGDGKDVLAFVHPDYIDEDSTDAAYTVMGCLQFTNTGEFISAQMGFDSAGELQTVWGYCPSMAFDVDYWHEIWPVQGDMFFVRNEFAVDGWEFGSDPVSDIGDTLTFGDGPLRLVTKNAEPGEYALCLGSEDMDGNFFWDYATVTVTD